jgi:uncharacterized membrane-anchored protein
VNELARKVPQLTIHFWIVKVLTTGMGEATSDYLVHTIDPYVAVGLGCIGLVLGLALQFFVRRYVAAVYWLAVVMVAIFGTMAADVVHFLGIPYAISTSFYAAGLALVFGLWYLVERTLSIHSICTWRREAFYWAAVIATFAMGTAAGDMTAYTLHLGWLVSGLVFAVLIALPALGYRFFGLNEVFAFWFAYIITRPLGASFSDWVGVPKSFGGLNAGRGLVAAVLTALIVVYVAYLSVSKVDVERTEPARPAVA